MTDADSTAVMAVKQVFEQRSMYDAVVTGNYMHHAELVAALAGWAQEFGRPLRIVDVGCGDASLAAKSLPERESSVTSASIWRSRRSSRRASARPRGRVASS